jgi:hypothetical protein
MGRIALSGKLLCEGLHIDVGVISAYLGSQWGLVARVCEQQLGGDDGLARSRHGLGPLSCSSAVFKSEGHVLLSECSPATGNSVGFHWLCHRSTLKSRRSS